MAFIFWPILFGPAGIIIGVVNLRRGEKKHGQQQIGLGALGLVFGFLISALVNGAFETGCSQLEYAARASEINANIQRLIMTPGRTREGLAAQNLFVEQTSRANAAMLRGDMDTACKIVDDLARRIN